MPWTVDGLEYATRKKLTIDNTKIDADLSDFPIAVILSADNFDFSKANPDGFDIRFTKSDGTSLLKYERERHDAVNQVAEYWVKVPVVSSSTDTDIYIYYRTIDTDDGADPASVWDSNYVGVWHKGESFNFTFQSRTETDVYASQGVAFDGTYFYTSDSSTLRKWSNTWELITSKKITGIVPPEATQINSLCYVSGKIYAGCNNYNDSPKKGWILEFNASDLSFVATYPVRDHWCEGCDFYGGYFWVVYCSTTSDGANIVSKYDSNWNWIADYDLSLYQAGWIGYQGIRWYNNHIYVNQHENGEPLTVDVYKWTGTEFVAVERTTQPTDQCTQGLEKDPIEPAKWYFAERVIDNGGHNVVTATYMLSSSRIVKDSTINLRCGMKIGVDEPIEADGKIGKAQQYDGENDYISIYTRIAITDGLSASCWFKSSTLDTYKIWMSRAAGNYWLANYSATALRFSITTDTRKDLNTTITFNDDNWHHLVNTYNGEQMKVYLDGEEVNSFDKTGDISATANIIIGKYTTYIFSGLLDEVSISDIARSAAWIKADFNSGNNSLLTYGEEEEVWLRKMVQII